MQVWMKKGLRGLECADDAAVDALRKVKLGTICSVEISRPRNVKFHRRFFAMLSLVWAAAGDWPTIEDLLLDVKVQIGHVEKRRLVNRSSGETFDYLIPKSIAFHNMDETEFSAFYERALMALCALAGDIDADYLRTEVLQQLAAA